MIPRKLGNLENVVWYDLEDYAPILGPFCDYLVSEDGLKFTLGDDNERGKLNVWNEERPEVKLMAAVFDTAVLHFLNTIHPAFRGRNKEYFLEKDGWLTSVTTRQHVVKHVHIPPYIREEDVGEVITIFYAYLDESIGPDNGPLEFFESKDSEEPLLVWTPKKYALVVMPPDVWHRARPFTGRRYSLATDVKVFDVAPSSSVATTAL
jgi:hypothetical protein